jgi:hypothetical protein
MNTSGDNDSVRYRTPDHIIYVSGNEILETTTETVSGNAHTRNKEDSEEEKGEWKVRIIRLRSISFTLPIM